MKVRELKKPLVTNGWRQVRTTGDHHIYKHTDLQVTLVVPGNDGRELPRGVLQQILKSAGFDLKEMRNRGMIQCFRTQSADYEEALKK